MAVLIGAVDEGSPAYNAGIRAGDTLLSINGNAINDVLDYRFYMVDRRLDLSLLRAGKPFSAMVRKQEYAELGLEFETYLMDSQRSCKNKCMFCFVDQMPPGMRESLYFKDDDSRLSFLFGNYITMTNLTPDDLERMIKMRISPVNVSVHTTDPKLRVAMMKNPNAARIMDDLRKLTQSGIRVNTQLVLVPGVNDGAALERSLDDLSQLMPNLQSIACVPVGLTKYRDGLENIEPYDAGGAKRVLDIVERFRERMTREHGEPVACASDEFFLKAGRAIPQAGYYGAFDQLEDGVGLVSLLRDDFTRALEDDGEQSVPGGDYTILTGVSAAPLIRRLADKAAVRHPNARGRVLAVENSFFGSLITVAGLLTAPDLLARAKGEQLGERVLIPSVMLRREGDCFLDGMTLEQFSSALQRPVFAIDNDGAMLYNAVTGRLEHF